MNYQRLYIKCILVYIQRYNFEQIGLEISKKKTNYKHKIHMILEHHHKEISLWRKEGIDMGR